MQDGDDADDPGAFEKCVNEPLCAARTVQNYLLKFKQDCNADDVINCYDYASIHLLGGYGCTGGLPLKYIKTITKCVGLAERNSFLALFVGIF